MKHSALIKDIIREIKKSFGRFFSIFAIVAIGVAFFAGVTASVPVMKASADAYFDEYNLMDLKLISTIGLTKEDITEIKKIKGIEGVYGSHSLDAITMKDNDQRVIKVMSFPMQMQDDDPNYMNQPRLLKGRLPQKNNECLMEASNLSDSGFEIGDTIQLTSGTEKKLEEDLKQNAFTITGTIHSPLYLSHEKGSSSIGSGKVNHFILIPDENFTSKYYSEGYVTIQSAKQLNTYQDAYFDAIEDVKTNISMLGDKQSALRFEDIKKEAQAKIDEGKREYEKNKQTYDTEIKKAKDELSSAHDKALLAQASLEANKINAQQTFQEKEIQLQQLEQVLTGLQTQYTQVTMQVEKDKQQLEEERANIQSQIQEAEKQLQMIDSSLQEVEEQLQNPNLTQLEKRLLEEKKKGLETAKNISQPTLNFLQTQIATMQRMIDGGLQQLQSIQKQIDAAKQQINTGKQQLANAKVETQKQFEQAQKQINQGNTQMIQGQSALEKQEKDGAAKLAEAKELLNKNEVALQSMETPQWYVLDRHSHYSYMDYGSAADRMGGIAKVFPLFFFLVAALVCLTTMTRMVDEQRQEIGTLKALGYTKGHIALKFVIYAGVASVFGGIFGAIVGMSLFPTVIFNAWNIIYTIPNVHLVMDIPLALLAIVLVAGITIASAIAAVYKELIDVPSQLMRPKAPVNGKKIMLERIPFIWKHFSFIYKVTARNIFRYKKRFFMTVIGISGCTALLLSGFGIRDSIKDIPAMQYGDIYQFDVSMRFESDASTSKREEVSKQLQNHESVDAAMGMGVYNGFYEDEKEDKGITIYVPMDVNAFKDFVDLHTRVGKETLRLNNEGAIITEKVANDLHVKKGDNIRVDTGDGIKKDVKITGICENYIGHALYMTPVYYKSVFQTTAKQTDLFATMNTDDVEQETVLGNTFMNAKDIASVTFFSSAADSFEQTIASLSFVIVVLIISAGLLAFVVLYNLTNVNISERVREIATIKVLGFYDKEVSSYVYRENIFLTLIGAIAGLVLGIFLHALIMQLAEMDNVMFGRNIYWISFVYSVVITMSFSLIVNFVMYQKLIKIPMVESLKSVE